MVSDTDAQLDIEIEYEECKNTARVYLQAVGVLEPDKVSMPQFREQQIRRIENLLLKDGIVEKILPDDPDTRDAGMLAYRFLQGDHDPTILDTLLSNASKPACEMVVEVLKRSMLAMGADIPDQLRMWKPESSNGKKRRLRKNPTRNHRIGMVVEALVMGSNVLNGRKKSERKLERQQRESDLLMADMAVIREEAGKSFGELSNEYFIEHLNKKGARPWRTWNGGKGLTQRDMVELSKQRLLVEAGINVIMPQIKWSSEDEEAKPTKQQTHGPTISDATKPQLKGLSEDESAEAAKQQMPEQAEGKAIMPQFTVRKHFPNLYATRNDATMDGGFAYSICDAVAEVLKKPNKPSPYRTVFRGWMTYRNIR